MTASQARQLATETNVSRAQEEAIKVMEVIQAEVKKGNFSAFINGHVSDALKAQLKADGFSVKRETEMGQSFTTISWDK